jgi:hypothetical protein
MAIRISGTTVPIARAITIASERFTEAANRGPVATRSPVYFFENFFLTHVITVLNTAGGAFVGTTEYITDVRARLIDLHQRLDDTRTAWLGRTAPGHVVFSQIPVAQRAAARNLIDNGVPAPGHDRGAHGTNPVVGGGGTVREYDLTAAADGRMTRRTDAQGRRGFYYSRHHAAATYQYLLITDSRGRPIVRNFPAADDIPSIPCP